VYFSPDSAENLADCLNRVYAEFDPATEAAYAKQRPLYKTKIEQDWIGDFAQIMKSACQPRFRPKSAAFLKRHVHNFQLEAKGIPKPSYLSKEPIRRFPIDSTYGHFRNESHGSCIAGIT